MDEFPNPSDLRAERIRAKVAEGLTFTNVAVWFASNTISRKLLTVEQEELIKFITMLHGRLILKTPEKLDIVTFIINNNIISALDKLCEYLQGKSEGDIVELIAAFQQNPSLASLGGYLNTLLERCRAAVDPVEEHVSMKVEVPTDHEDYVIQRISTNRSYFRDRVLHLEADILYVNTGCIHLRLKLEDSWDLQNLEHDIKVGLFQKRLALWLSEDGVQILDSSIKVISLNREKEGDFAKSLEEKMEELTSDERGAVAMGIGESVTAHTEDTERMLSGVLDERKLFEAAQDTLDYYEFIEILYSCDKSFVPATRHTVFPEVQIEKIMRAPTDIEKLHHIRQALRNSPEPRKIDEVIQALTHVGDQKHADRIRDLYNKKLMSYMSEQHDDSK